MSPKLKTPAPLVTIAWPAVPSKAGNVKFTSAAVAVDAFNETNFPLVELINLNSPSVPCEVVV